VRERIAQLPTAAAIFAAKNHGRSNYRVTIVTIITTVTTAIKVTMATNFRDLRNV
jgi:hypothetical protein